MKFLTINGKLQKDADGKIIVAPANYHEKFITVDDKLLKTSSALIKGETLPVPVGKEMWILKDDLDILLDETFTVNFTCAETNYSSMSISLEEVSGGLIVPFLRYQNSATTTVYSETWVDYKYKTIILDTPATGSFLFWLESNAIKYNSVVELNSANIYYESSNLINIKFISNEQTFTGVRENFDISIPARQLYFNNTLVLSNTVWTSLPYKYIEIISISDATAKAWLDFAKKTTT